LRNLVDLVGIEPTTSSMPISVNRMTQRHTERHGDAVFTRF
jgi:hypothetical protein